MSKSQKEPDQDNFSNKQILNKEKKCLIRIYLPK